MPAANFKEKQILLRYVRKCHVDIHKLRIWQKIYKYAVTSWCFFQPLAVYTHFNSSSLITTDTFFTSLCFTIPFPLLLTHFQMSLSVSQHRKPVWYPGIIWGCVIFITPLPAPCSHGFSCLVSSMPILWLDLLSSGAKNTKITIFPPLICSLLHSGHFSTVFKLPTCDTCLWESCSHGLVTRTPHCFLSHNFYSVERCNPQHGRLFLSVSMMIKMCLLSFFFFIPVTLSLSLSLSLSCSQQHVNISQGFYQRASSRAPADLPRRGGYRKS